MISKSLAFLLLLSLSPLLAIITVLILLFDGRPVFFIQKRVGVDSSYFNIYKFRTMKLKTPNVATRLLENSEHYISKTGSFLRKFGLDELPNLYNIIRGEMGFVGPRPVLFNEYDLLKLRKNFGIDKMLPGLTGLAQINGRNDLPPELKIKYEIEYLKNNSLQFDIKIILRTIIHSSFR